MKNHPKPEVGNWYQDTTDDQLFEIVAIDDDDQAIEIQYFDGAVEELDYVMWEELEIVTAAAPEDWSGPFDDLEADDLADPDTPVELWEFNDHLDEM
jgi:hypothetical protein